MIMVYKCFEDVFKLKGILNDLGKVNLSIFYNIIVVWVLFY